MSLATSSSLRATRISSRALVATSRSWSAVASSDPLVRARTSLLGLSVGDAFGEMLSGVSDSCKGPIKLTPESTRPAFFDVSAEGAEVTITLDGRFPTRNSLIG